MVNTVISEIIGQSVTAMACCPEFEIAPHISPARCQNTETANR